MNSVNEAFPILSKIAMDSIHVPASNVAVESLFSHVTEVKWFKRSKLCASNLNDILTLLYADLYMDSYKTTDLFKSQL